jgi:arylsulfatase A-like enzyme
VLAGAGYRTGYVGKWHLDGVPRDRFTPPGPRRQGFDYWAVWNCSHAYFQGCLFRDDPARPLALDGYEPVGQTDVALEFLAADDPRPFCLFLSWGPPHAPYDQVPDDYKRLYDASTIELRPNVRPEPDPPFHKTGQEFDPRAIADYYAHITAIDEQMGRLLDALDARGLADDTIVVFTSDHGDMLWSQGMQKKEQPFEEAILIPLLVRWPGRVPAGAASDALVSIVDLAPTLLGLMGQGVPDAMEGADLSAIARGADADGPQSVFLTEPIILDQGFHRGVREWRGVRTRRHTYARWITGEPWLLYDNEADPYQLANLVDSPEHQAVRDELERELQRWLDRTGDRWGSWQDVIRDLGIVEKWNEREQYMHPNAPRLLEG